MQYRKMEDFYHAQPLRVPTFLLVQQSSVDLAEMITVVAMKISSSISRIKLKFICQ